MPMLRVSRLSRFFSTVLTIAVVPLTACEAGDGLDEESLADTGDTGSPQETGDTSDTGETGETGDEQEPPPVPPAYDEWLRIEIPETYCSDGSQYKFFVNWHEGADDLLVIFEPGGACWDYASCSGELGMLGAANPHGIPDDHMNLWGIHSPLVRRDSPDNPMREWNMVFVPYCTGDVHTGSQTTVYESEDGSSQLTYRHVGHDNMLRVSEWLGWAFQDTDQMYAGGCSAGGVGSNINYYFLRDAIEPNLGYLVNDSGPLFPNSVNSAPLHAEIREVWGLDEVIQDTPIAAALGEDFGAINAELADLFPNDRLAITYFIRDYNFSRYSYERFYPGIDEEGVHQKFYEDTLLLMEQYDSRENLAYYLPFFRDLNDSHCASIFDFALTDIGDWKLGDFIELVLDDGEPLQSRVDLDGSQGP
jgi:hypothetical protein